jgi:arylsulfatase A-like enzyme
MTSMGTPDRPNILFLLTDDQGPWAAGCYGNPEIRTPNLDRLAASGTRFDNFFVATPVCSPSRATLLTGRIPSQHGVHDWLKDGNVGPDAIRYLEGEVAYTDLLARNGWTCGLSGKWHLGDSQIPQHGFTDWFSHQFGGGRYNDAPMVRNGQLVDEPGYVTDAITEEALRLLDRYTDLGVPFYLSVHYTAPHSPWTGHPQDLVDSYDDCPFASCPQEPVHPWAKEQGLTKSCMGNREMLKGYFAAVTAMDANVGRLLDRLEELGLRENTLVVFVSDNGFSCGHHGFWGKGNGTSPRNMYENSIKVPFLVSHPGSLPEGRVTDAMVSAYDFMPTLLDYLGLPMPERPNSPGHSFLPVLRGESSEGREDVVLFDEYGPVRMIRTAEWKYAYRHAHGPHELYDLVNDPDERSNLAGAPDRADLIRDLKARMDEWFARYVEGRRDGLLQDGTRMGQGEFVAR